MRPLLLAVSGFALVMAGCSKHAPVAATPKAPDTTPVAAAPAPAPAPLRAAQPPAQAPARQPVAQAARPTTMPPEVRQTLNERLAKLEDALFDYDKSTIRPDAGTALKDDVTVIRDILNAYPSQKLVIEGHADERGSEEYNLALGDRRAESAKDFLTSMGVSSGQLTLISYGKDRPICSDESEACWQRNRRVHITAAQ